MASLRRCPRVALLAVIAVCIAANGIAGTSETDAGHQAMDCLPAEPDSVQISWDSPCQDGSWLMDSEVGCRMWDWHPAPEDGATWTGRCRAGKKIGRGMVQWFEHGRPIDRFLGSFIAGRRQGLGLYVWNETDWYDGYYEDDVPHGLGTAHIAGEVFVGQWNRGCLKQGLKVVAIGVLRKSCEKNEERMVRQRADFE